jgi:hypothetical protein
VLREPFDVRAEVAVRLRRLFERGPGALGAFVHLGERGADHAAVGEHEVVMRARPGGEFGLGIDRDIGERRPRVGLRVTLDRLGDEGGLGAEGAEERHFVDTRLIGDASGGRAAESDVGVDADGGIDDLLSDWFGHFGFVKTFTTQATTCLQRKQPLAGFTRPFQSVI